MKMSLIILFITLSITLNSKAQSNNTGVEKDAVQKVQKCLREQNCESMQSEKGKAADQRAALITNNSKERKTELYDMSADIFATLMQNAGNDPNKAAELLQKAQTNPEAFLNSLTPEQKLKINNMAKQIESENNNRP